MRAFADRHRRPAAQTGRGTACVIGLLMLTGMNAYICAEPYVPQRDDQVLERVPSGGWFNPNRGIDFDVALKRAHAYLARSGETGDPRLAGRAEALLMPWLVQPEVPSAVLLVRAIIRQQRHEFDAALRDLDAVLAVQPRHVQALLTQATIHQVVGAYPQSRASCLRLLGLIGDLTVVSCLAGVSSLAGYATPAFDTLARLLDQHPRASVEERRWALVTLAEIAVRLGRDAHAETRFREALSLGPPGMYLLTQYADFLLDTGRFHEVLALVEAHQAVDALALRHARALRGLRSPVASASIGDLSQRLEAMERRGDNAAGTRAGILLHLLDRPAEALGFALKNWATQREPADARLVLEAALAAEQPAAAQPVLDWLRRSGLEDVRLERLRRQLGAL